MEKFTKFHKANLKRYAQIMDPLISKRNKVVTKIAELQKEVEKYQQQIDMTDALVKNMTGGYSIESIVRKVITPTDKFDKNGNIVKQTNYEFIYPETIVPPVMEVPSTEGLHGSDFDVDSEDVDTELATFNPRVED